MRSLNLDQLRAFIEVVERGSFTAAAKELNLTQPAVTHQVQELERRFQVSLVERFGKRAYLTQAGEKLIEHARNLLDEDSRAHVAMRRFGDGWLGRVRVGTSMTVLMYVLPPILRQLKTDHPQLEINLKAGLTTTTLKMLKTNALDMGLCALPIDDPAFETVPLFNDELVAILPAALGQVPKKVTPAFLCQCPLILGSENSALRRTIADWLALAGPPPRPLMEFDNVEAMKSVVAVGLGASIVPSLSLGAGHVSAANMLVRPLSPRASRRVGLVRLRGKQGTDGMELIFAALSALRRRPSARSTTP
jgi:DNA-binding transcriptional LysR family regulator